MKILLFGSSGLLGKEITKNTEHVFLTPSHKEIDICDIEDVAMYILASRPDIVINAAAFIDNRKIEQDPKEALATNIIGASNVAIICERDNIRLVYISTDYLYPGDRGNYKEDDPIMPFNNYAWSKLGGECASRLVKNHLIIRTSFGGNKFSYPVAFTDKWSSKEYVDVIAPQILEAAISPLTGVLNIGSKRKTIYEHASERTCVDPVKLSETSHRTPYDTSLNLQKWIDYKSAKPIAKPHTNCRCCGSDKLVKYLDLGLMPLANNLETTSIRAKEVERFPLQVMFCEDCGLSQLSVVIDPVKMYSYYTYRSSVNGGYVKHCREMAYEILSDFPNAKTFLHIDIAGNDGTLLKQFLNYNMINQSYYTAINVDPASNLCAIAEAQGIESIVDFWSVATAFQIIETKGRMVDLITATNVFAHVDDIQGFLEAAKICLNPEGLLVIECPYLIDFIENFEFDTVYFEHLSYMSVLPLNKLANELGLKIVSITPQAIHGGTIRIKIAHDASIHTVEQSVFDYAQSEFKKGFTESKKYTKWSSDVKKVINSFGEEVLKLKKEGFKIAAFAASAKGNTLLNASGINTDIIDYICDQTPEKIGKFSPGTGIPIVHPQELLKNPPDYLVILSWNFSDEIMTKVRALGFKGKFIIPIPEFSVI